MKVKAFFASDSKVTLSIDEFSGRLTAYILWPMAASSKDKEVKFVFTGSKWVDCDSFDTLRKDTTFGAILYKVIGKIQNMEVTQKL